MLKIVPLSLLFCIFGIFNITNAKNITKDIPKETEFLIEDYKINAKLHPCNDTNSDDQEANSYIKNEWKQLPENTCKHLDLINKIFAAHYLQYNAITVVNDPWNIDLQIKKQNKTLKQCKDIQCLNKELQNIITMFMPAFKNPTTYNRKRNISKQAVGSQVKCGKDLSNKQQSKLLPQSIITAANSACGEDNNDNLLGFNASICSYKNNKFISTRCNFLENSNEVNEKEQLYKIEKNNFKLIYDDYAVELNYLTSECNGMPDLLFSARRNMGEQDVRYYRYNEFTYKIAYSYILSTSNPEFLHDITTHFIQCK